jgi:PKD repeat protein
MKTLKTLLLISGLIFGIQAGFSQCQAGFTYVDNGNGNFTFTNTSNPSTIFSSWTFGDGNSSWSASPSNTSNTYLNDGAYEVCLSIFDSLSQCSSTFCDSIWVTGATNPCAGTIAGFTYIDNGGGNFSFTNTSTPSTIFSSWTFGDGNTSWSATPSNASNTYLTDGTYTVCLSIFDSLTQCQNTFCDNIVVAGAANSCTVNASFNVTDNGGGNYTFNNTSTGTGLDYYWNFGDGNGSINTSPNHTYLSNGVYSVQLYAFDPIDSNCYDFTVVTINVTGVSNPVACQAGFIVFPDSANPGNVIVVNNSTGNNLSYYWSFGDGNFSTLQYPSYTYSSNGPFELCLTVSDGFFCTSTYCDSIFSGGTVLKQNGFTINVQAPVITGVEEPAEVVTELSTFPNPFQGNLNIAINLIESTNVDVYVTNLLGARVGNIMTGEMQSGYNQLKWNSEDLPNGIYLLNVKANDIITVKKLVLTK